MILVEADADGEWDSRTDWQSLADKAARAAIAHSRFAALADSPACAEVSVKFTTDDEVRELNAAYRHRDKATNVLSFPMLEPEELEALTSAGVDELLLGDIVVAAGICASEAAERGITIEAHAAHLVTHGILHLLGYDHETRQRDAEEMEQIEREALASIDIADPYPAAPGLQDQHHG
jgi:probable rRNA maturation factor